MNNSKHLIAIVGATAVGKTAFAIELAKRLNVEIISADSRQFYREMNIGTAKPTNEELGEVPHHFINNLSIHQRHYSAGKFETEILAFLENYFKTHDTAIMVGGSGLFINAVCNGFDQMETAEPEQLVTLRNLLNTKCLTWLQEEVQRLDPAYYALADIKNPVRLKRALEIIYTTGKKYSEQRIGKKAERPFRITKIGLKLERAVLNERINKRVDEMLQKGLLDEVKELYAYRNLPALNTVGYTELFDYLEDKISLENAIALIKQNTRNYAKRQMTWFKKDEAVMWFEADNTDKIRCALCLNDEL